MKQVIAAGLGLLFSATAVYAADATDTTATTTAPAKHATKKSKVLEKKAAKRTAKVMDTTGKAMEKAVSK